MKNTKRDLTLCIALLGVVFFTADAWASTKKSKSKMDAPISGQLQSLKLPDNVAPAGVSAEDLNKAKTRKSELAHRTELSVSSSHVIGSNGYYDSNELGGRLSHFLSNRFFLTGQFDYVSNRLNESGEQLIHQKGILPPDTSYAKYRGYLGLGMNTFYGKLAFTRDAVLYFDQYVQLSPGVVVLNTGTRPSVAAEAGFSFWLGHWGVVRLAYTASFYQNPSASSGNSQMDSILVSGLGVVF